MPRYCVRPNSGRIEPSHDVEVQVLLQAMKEDPPPDAKCRDKFLVQSVGVPSNTDPSASVAQIWSHIEQTAKSSIQEKKIRVNFLPADGAATTNGIPSSTKEEDEMPPAYQSPSAVTPQRGGSDTRDTSMADSTMGSTIIGGASGMASSAASAVPTSSDELKQQLSAAQAEVARLREQASEGIRNRKPQEAASKAVESAKQSMQQGQAPGGVPVQIVAGLCLLCFLIAYLFF